MTLRLLHRNLPGTSDSARTGCGIAHVNFKNGDRWSAAQTAAAVGRHSIVRCASDARLGDISFSPPQLNRPLSFDSGLIFWLIPLRFRQLSTV